METKTLITFILTVLLPSATFGQKHTTTDFYNPDFKWTIAIPDSFKFESTEKWSRVQTSGKWGIEQAYSTKLNNKVNTILILRAGTNNFLEATSEPYEVSKRGDYTTTCRHMTEVLYNSFVKDRPDAKLDTSTSVVSIDGLEFMTLNLTAHFPKGIVKYSNLYFRLFGTYALTISVIYSDSKQAI